MRWILSSDSDFGVSVFEISMCQDSGKAWSAMPCVCLMFGERYQSFPRVDPENKFFYIRTRGSTTLRYYLWVVVWSCIYTAVGLIWIRG